MFRTIPKFIRFSPRVFVDASKSMPEAPGNRLKQTTRITGLPVHPDPCKLGNLLYVVMAS